MIAVFGAGLPDRLLRRDRGAHRMPREHSSRVRSPSTAGTPARWVSTRSGIAACRSRRTRASSARPARRARGSRCASRWTSAAVTPLVDANTSAAVSRCQGRRPRDPRGRPRVTDRLAVPVHAARRADLALGEVLRERLAHPLESGAQAPCTVSHGTSAVLPKGSILTHRGRDHGTAKTDRDLALEIDRILVSDDEGGGVRGPLGPLG